VGNAGGIEQDVNMAIGLVYVGVPFIFETKKDIPVPAETVLNRPHRNTDRRGWRLNILIRACRILNSLAASLFLDLGKTNIVAFELMSHSTRLTCCYAHRMQNTKGHAPIRDVLKAVGIILPSKVHTKRSANQLIRRLSVRRNSTSNNGTLG